MRKLPERQILRILICSVSECSPSLCSFCLSLCFMLSMVLMTPKHELPKSLPHLAPDLLLALRHSQIHWNN